MGLNNGASTQNNTLSLQYKIGQAWCREPAIPTLGSTGISDTGTTSVYIVKSG